MLVRVDPGSGVPIFDQLAASVRADLAAGVLSPGDRLAPAREVADALDINIHTVLRAYQALRDEGLIELRRGRGAVVTEAAALPGDLLEAVRGVAREAHTRGVGLASVLALIREEYTR